MPYGNVLVYSTLYIDILNYTSKIALQKRPLLWAYVVFNCTYSSLVSFSISNIYNAPQALLQVKLNPQAFSS